MLIYYQLYAYLDDADNTLLLLRPLALKTLVRRLVEEALMQYLLPDLVHVSFDEVRAVADYIVYNAQRAFPATLS